MKFFIPRATPYAISPIAAAFASLVKPTGILLRRSENSFAKGTLPSCAHDKFGANSIEPL